MKYLAIIVKLLELIRDGYRFVVKQRNIKARETETKKVEELKKDTAKDIENADIDKLNDKLKF